MGVSFSVKCGVCQTTRDNERRSSIHIDATASHRLYKNFFLTEESEDSEKTKDLGETKDLEKNKDLKTTNGNSCTTEDFEK